MTHIQLPPRLSVHISAKRTRRTHYVISDSPVTDDAVEGGISPDDLVKYLQAKQEFEKWQRRLSSARRWGGSWI